MPFGIPGQQPSPMFQRPPTQQRSVGVSPMPAQRFGFGTAGSRPRLGTAGTDPRSARRAKAEEAGIQATQYGTEPAVQRPLYGKQPITQSGYEQQALLGLQSQLGSKAAEEGFGRQKELLQMQQAAQPSVPSPQEMRAWQLEDMQAQQQMAERDIQAQLSGQRELLGERARLGQQSQERMMGFLPQIMGQMPAPVGLGGDIGGQEEAARAAAFGRAKEQAGGTALSALRALQDFAAERGQTGSSMERGMIGDVVGGAAGMVDDYTREQLIQDLENAAQRRNLQYQGGIAQRGQNLAMMPSLLGLLQSGGGLY